MPQILLHGLYIVTGLPTSLIAYECMAASYIFHRMCRKRIEGCVAFDGERCYNKSKLCTQHQDSMEELVYEV